MRHVVCTTLVATVVISATLASPGGARAQETTPPRIRTNAGMPQVSPDGKYVLFVSDRDGKSALYVMNIDGTGARRIRDLACCTSAWLPDSKRLIVSEAIDRATMRSRIVVMNLDGSAQREIATGTMAMGANVSPDGKRVAYFSAQRVEGQQMPKFRVHVVGIDGGTPRVISDTTGTAAEPRWSPDGKRLSFISLEASGTHMPRSTTISVINPDGSAAKPIATVPLMAQLFSWSPDGKSLAFQGADPSDPHNEANVYVIDVATGQYRALTHHDTPQLDETPVWLPDGSGLLFQTNRHGPTEIYRMNPDGSNQRRLTR
jgi:Tol biopolymer transport system component